MPRIIERNELQRLGTYVKRFVISAEDADKWMKAENTLVKAVDSIRLAFSIAGNPPPLLSSFGFTRSHKTYGIAKRIITVSRDWFAIWMGFIAYLIAMTEGENRGVIKGSPLPSWYQHLLTRNFQDPWLNGMMLSNVCSFDAQTPHAGVIFQWIQNDLSRPTIEWFYRHHIPIWFIWSRAEEDAISYDRQLAYLRPPNFLLQNTLSFICRNPDFPLAALIVQRFFDLQDRQLDHETIKILNLHRAGSYATGFMYDAFLLHYEKLGDVKDYELEEIVAQKKIAEDKVKRAAEAAVLLPWQGMVEKDKNERGRLFSHFDEFFAAREK